MEEKERYEVHIYDDVCVDLYNNGVLDKSINDTYNLENLLNQQDTRIKDLEEENKELEIKLDKCGTELVNAESLVSYLENENRQLKQQLHELPKKIVEEVEKNFTEYLPLKYKTGAGFYCRLNAILKKYGDKNESNND